MQLKDTTAGAGINIFGIGGWGSFVVPDEEDRKVNWRELTTTSIKVDRGNHNDYGQYVRIRIWVYK